MNEWMNQSINHMSYRGAFAPKNSGIFHQGSVKRLKITKRTTTSERKQLFSSNSKFQIECVRKQLTYVTYSK